MMNMDKSTLTATHGGLPPSSNNNDPEEALLPELGLSPSRYVPVEIAAQHHHHHQQQQQQQQHGYATAPPTQLDLQQTMQHQDHLNMLPSYATTAQSLHFEQPQTMQQQQDPLNALTTLAVAAAPPLPEQQQQIFSLLDIMTGPHPSSFLQQQQQQGGVYSFATEASNEQQNPFSLVQPPPQASAPLLNLDDPAALAKVLQDKDKEIKALRRALNKAQRKNPPPAPRDTTASMIGEAVLSITKTKNEPEAEQMDPTKIKNLQERWKARFQQLVRYKLTNGHSNVPKSYHDAPLHAWVRKQRINKQIRDRTGGIKGLNDEQVEALNSIGFAWVIGHQPRDDLWNSNFERLVQLYAVHGYIPTHCNDKSLTKWMQNQRARRKLLEAHGEGKARGMSWERVQKLDSIGFTWDARK
jgi:hypothetical protein